MKLWPMEILYLNSLTDKGNDIGGALMRETIKRAKEAGIKAIALMGEPNYYPRFGFKLWNHKGESSITKVFENLLED